MDSRNENAGEGGSGNRPVAPVAGNAGAANFVRHRKVYAKLLPREDIAREGSHGMPPAVGNAGPATFGMHPMTSIARAGGPAGQPGFNPLFSGVIPTMPQPGTPFGCARAMDDAAAVAQEREIEALKHRVARGENMNEALVYRVEATEKKLKEIMATIKERDEAAMDAVDNFEEAETRAIRQTEEHVHDALDELLTRMNTAQIIEQIMKLKQTAANLRHDYEEALYRLQLNTQMIEKLQVKLREEVTGGGHRREGGEGHHGHQGHLGSAHRAL